MHARHYRRYTPAYLYALILPLFVNINSALINDASPLKPPNNSVHAH